MRGRSQVSATKAHLPPCPFVLEQAVPHPGACRGSPSSATQLAPIRCFFSLSA